MPFEYIKCPNVLHLTFMDFNLLRIIRHHRIIDEIHAARGVVRDRAWRASSRGGPDPSLTEEGLPEPAGINRRKVKSQTQARGSSIPRSSMRSMHTGEDDRAWRARAWRAARRGGPGPSLPKRDYPKLQASIDPKSSAKRRQEDHPTPDHR